MARANEYSRLIGAVLPPGVAADVVQRLQEEKGINRATVSGARGLDHLVQFAPRGTDDAVAMEILNVVVPAARADEIFDFVFDAARIDRPDGGIVFQHALSGAMPFTLPEGQKT